MSEKEEIIRCSNDFAYFCETYLKTVHRSLGLIPLKLYDFQKTLFELYENNKFLAVVKFRRGGFSTLAVAYFFWQCLFKLDKSFMVLCGRDSCAVEHSHIAKKMFWELPEWLKPKIEYNDHRMHFYNSNSEIRFSKPLFAYGKALDCLYIDEPAFIPNMEDHWQAIYPLLGSCIATGCPNRKNNWFYKIIESNLFKVYQPSYKDHPEYNGIGWAENMIALMGERNWRQEVLGEFI